MKTSWVSRFGRILVLVTSGGMALGTSCAHDVRNSITSAELDYVESITTAVLEALIPLDAFTKP